MAFKATQLEDHFPDQFGTSFDHVLQQQESRLWGCATHDTVKGKRKSYNKIGKAKMRKVTTRKGDTVHSKHEFEKLWVDTCPYDHACCFDEDDDIVLGDLPLPTSEVVQSAVSAYGRLQDEVIIEALGGTVFNGEHGQTACELPDAQKVPVDYVKSGAPTNTGLTYVKLVKALSILGKNEAYGQNNRGGMSPKLVLNQCALDEMLCDEFFINSDYTGDKPTDTGVIAGKLGVEFIRSELLPVDKVTDIGRAYLFVPGALRAVTQRGRETLFDILPDKNHALQIRTRCRLGATRYEDGAVVEIYFDQSAA